MEEKRSYSELSADMAAAGGHVHIGALYRHYKNGHDYKVLGFGVLEATNEIAVLYQPQAEGSDLTFIRPVVDWLAEVTWEGKTVQRFAEV